MIPIGGALVALLRPTYARYLAASGAALTLDLVLFLMLLRAGLPPAWASAIGYAAGIAAHWSISSRAVFSGAVAEDGVRRRAQQALFLGSAVVGLSISTATVALGDWLGLDPRLAKLGALALAFQAVWLLRRHIVFAR